MQTTYKTEELSELSVQKCAVIYALELVAGKWKLPIIWKIGKYKVIRYNQLKRELDGITNRMLTKCLKELVEDALVSRQVIYRGETDKMDYVEYGLTAYGEAMIPALELMGAVGKDLIAKRAEQL